MFEFDFFQKLETDIRKYRDKGDIFIAGDLNSRTGLLPDYIEDIQLDRYIDMPSDSSNQVISDMVRLNCDKVVNPFGRKLLSLCKENEIVIANGRLEPGDCTYYGLHRNRPVSSTVDYILTGVPSLESIYNMSILDQMEFSDHCPMYFSFQCRNYTEVDNIHQNPTVDKIIWDSSSHEDFRTLLNLNKNKFDDIENKFLSNEYTIDDCINNLSDVIQDVSFKCHGKTFSSKRLCKPHTRKSEWFNEECKKIKADFLNAKRIKNLNPSDENKTHFLTCRSLYAKAKRKAKLKYYCKEKQKLSNLSKTAPRNFWKYIKKYKNKKVCDMDNMNINNLVEHFQNLSNTPHEHQEYEDSVYNDVQIDALDAPFTVEEISKTISTLKRHKSADLENNVADFFIDANAFISPYLLHVFDTGIYPES
jgi:hypothetical protein